jgi:hypothetical protein
MRNHGPYPTTGAVSEITFLNIASGELITAQSYRFRRTFAVKSENFVVIM